jgi:hypothetical protein
MRPLRSNRFPAQPQGRERPLRLKAAKRRLLVGEIGKYAVQIREAKNFLCPRAQIHRAQVGIVLACRKDRPNQLTDSRTVEIGDVPQIQKDSFASVAEKIAQQFMHSFAFDHGESAAYVHDRNVAYLPGAGTETQSVLRREPLFYRMQVSISKC